MSKRVNELDSVDFDLKKRTKATERRHRSLVWFRSDLRIKDNMALSQALSYAGTSDGVIAVYIVSPDDWKRHDWGPVKVDFIRRNLISLQSSLNEELNVPFCVLKIDSFTKIPDKLAEFARENEIDIVWFNNELEWDEVQRDSQVEETLSKSNIMCRRFDDQCIVKPGLVLTKESRPYSVFTPFKNTWAAHLESNPVKLETYPVKQSKFDFKSSKIDELFADLPVELKYQQNLESISAMWPAGELEAQARLDDFAQFRMRNYKESRDFPNLDKGTSVLSPYLALGVISARTCFVRAKTENHGKLLTGNEGICVWISELCWRDFYRHILHHFPRVARGKPFKVESDQVEWRYPKVDEQARIDFDRWCRGFTGFPIVDAAMRQLNSTGWMHNRLRMIVSAFLTKDLLIDWRYGEKYFMQHLIDGDFASNNGGWQWSASTGTDSQPYFRVFNPQSQSERFDPSGDFIRKWIPALKDFSNDTIHVPSKKLSTDKLKKIGYCEPMIDHAKARIKAIEAFKKVYSSLK